MGTLRGNLLFMFICVGCILLGFAFFYIGQGVVLIESSEYYGSKSMHGYGVFSILIGVVLMTIAILLFIGAYYTIRRSNPLDKTLKERQSEYFICPKCYARVDKEEGICPKCGKKI